MTNKELFIKVIERALGNIVVENDLTACFSFCDEISYVVDGSYRLIATAEGFWNFWKEETYNA